MRDVDAGHMPSGRCGYTPGMAPHFEIEPLGEREYLLRARSSTQMVESRLQLTQADLDDLQVASADERRVVEATTEFLAERQPELDLPHFLDLNDIVASYADFPQELRRRLAAMPA